VQCRRFFSATATDQLTMLRMVPVGARRGFIGKK